MEENRKLFEVILAPSDRLDKELEEVLGGMGSCGKNECHVNYSNCIENYCGYNGVSCGDNRCDVLCPEGYKWGGDACGCVPVG